MRTQRDRNTSLSRDRRHRCVFRLTSGHRYASVLSAKGEIASQTGWLIHTRTCKDVWWRDDAVAAYAPPSDP